MSNKTSNRSTKTTKTNQLVWFSNFYDQYFCEVKNCKCYIISDKIDGLLKTNCPNPNNIFTNYQCCCH